MTATAPNSPTTRLIVDIPAKDADALLDLANKYDTNRTTALVKAIRTLSWLEDEVATGSVIEIVAEDGSRHQLVLSPE